MDLMRHYSGRTEQERNPEIYCVRCGCTVPKHSVMCRGCQADAERDHIASMGDDEFDEWVESIGKATHTPIDMVSMTEAILKRR